jgi:ferredoxin
VIKENEVTMKILKVDEEICVNCGNCQPIFKGMPDFAMGEGITVPAWAEDCFDPEAVIKSCYLDAITVTEIEQGS